ncbi:MAG: TAXI family TRAP transporter solute-binding subunit [Paracoccaceae bacterium]|nr:TAXI family TRAP transporter solute-binding subunit [Paracoccaceae bacterium]
MLPRFKTLLAAGLATIVAASSGARAQEDLPSIGIMAGEFGSSVTSLGEELGEAMDGWSGTNVRIMLGKGSRQTVEDLLYLRGVDLGFVNADEMVNLQISDPNHPALRRLAYVAKAFDSELHLVVGRDSDINSVQDLNGRTISVGAPDADVSLTARLVLRMLGLQTRAVFLSTSEGLEALKRGEVEAVFYVGPAPSPVLQQIVEEDRLRLANIEFNPAFEGVYSPAEITADTYPGLVEDKFVETISVPTILAVYNRFPPTSARYRNLVRFTDAFLATAPRLGQPPRHPKWRELDLTAEIEGWTQFAYVRQALDRLQ